MLRIRDLPFQSFAELLGRFGLELQLESADAEIRGSFWGDEEAGLVGRCVYVRDDTPVHSLLHETSHVICMSEQRRRTLDRDAGGDDLEESAVCYLQIVLADELTGAGRQRIMQDMDEWGYSFRLGKTDQWFHKDSDDAREFLENHGLLSATGEPQFKLRQ